MGSGTLERAGWQAELPEDCPSAGGQHGGAGQGGVWAEAGVLCWTRGQDVVPPIPAVL